MSLKLKVKEEKKTRAWLKLQMQWLWPAAMRDRTAQGASAWDQHQVCECYSTRKGAMWNLRLKWVQIDELVQLITPESQRTPELTLKLKTGSFLARTPSTSRLSPLPPFFISVGQGKISMYMKEIKHVFKTLPWTVNGFLYKVVCKWSYLNGGSSWLRDIDYIYM